MLEVRDGSANVVAQVYGGTQYIDEVVAMRVEDGYMVVNQDANWNVVSATDLAGRVLERTFYTAYGLPTFNSETYFGDYDGDGEVDAADDAELGNGQTCWGASPAGACRVFDFDQDGDLDSADQTVMTALVALASTNHVRLARTSGTTGGLFAHQGLFLDAEIGQYQNRQRYYSAQTQRFAQRDPMGSVDGLDLYQYVQSTPLSSVDPRGTFVSQLEWFPDRIEITVSLVFWGPGAKSKWHDGARELREAWNISDRLGVPPSFWLCRPVVFKFPYSRVWRPGRGGPCDRLQRPDSNDLWGDDPFGCARTAQLASGRDVAIWVRDGHADDGPLLGQTDVENTERRVWVEREQPGFEPRRILAHEIGHVMRGKHTDEVGHGPPHHIMEAFSDDRTTVCHNVAQVVRRHGFISYECCCQGGAK